MPVSPAPLYVLEFLLFAPVGQKHLRVKSEGRATFGGSLEVPLLTTQA